MSEEDKGYYLKLPKEKIKFCQVDGEFVYDIIMELDQLQQQNKELQDKLKAIQEYVNDRKEYSETDAEYMTLEDIYEIIEGENK